jgi:hypothetical protein
MPRAKTKAHDLENEQVAHRMFPKKVREAVLAEAQKAKKNGAKSSTKKDSS